MHKLLLNTIEITIAISPTGPILIKSGVEEGVDPTLPNMNFVRTIHPSMGRTIYLPGSSLKGVIRSHAERIVTTVIGDVRKGGACDPLSKQSCDQRGIFARNSGVDKSDLTGQLTYKNICPICRMFGHTVMASRFRIPDAYPEEAINTLPVRQQVAIERRSGGSTNTFTLEVNTTGNFITSIRMHNFERWQLGLLALVLRDIEIGRIGIGFGKSRGLGQVTMYYGDIIVSYPGRQDTNAFAQHIMGVGELLDSDTAAAYDFAPAADLANRKPDIQSAAVTDDWAEVAVAIAPEFARDTMKQLVPDWASFAQLRIAQQ